MSLPLLSDHLAAQLPDPTSALAAAFIIANRHPEILQWAGHPHQACRPNARAIGAFAEACSSGVKERFFVARAAAHLDHGPSLLTPHVRSGMAGEDALVPRRP